MVYVTKGGVMSLLAQRGLEPEVLGILLTSKCNFTCRHCCNESEPANSETARFEEVARLIDEAREIPSIREVGVSGGEPFLFVSLLRSVVRHAAARGLRASVTTNGFWGRSRGAPRLLAELHSDGLTAVHISTSTFHQEFRGLDCVISAATIALDAGTRVTINVVATAELEPAAVREAFGTLAERVGFVVMPALPAGRAARDVSLAEFPASRAVPQGNCRSHFRKLAVDLAGDVYPCCSPGGFTEPLRIGNVGDAPLSAVVANSAGNRLLAILESVGPAYFLPFLRASGNDAELPRAFGDQCHLCHAMLSSPSCAATVADAADRLVEDLAAMPTQARPPMGPRMAAMVEAQTSAAALAERNGPNARGGVS
jgi:hypothetical protein